MKVLWQKSPLAAFDIIQLLAAEQWHQNTIKTLLTRLVKKGALAADKYKNLHLYRPLVTEEDCIQVESESFLDRFFAGSVKPLLVHFAKQEKITPEDLEELRKILRKQKK